MLKLMEILAAVRVAFADVASIEVTTLSQSSETYRIFALLSESESVYYKFIAHIRYGELKGVEVEECNKDTYLSFYYHFKGDIEDITPLVQALIRP